MRPSAIKFVVLLGIVSLFADMTYQGARSITGPYLALLGASAVVVGFVAGFGELLGYSLRLVSGYLADRTGKYWSIMITGYVCNLLAVPLLALVNHWWMASILIILERTGKAIRTPARDAMLSHASQRIGMGWGFGLHEALDQTGAMAGPLLVALVLYYKDGYHYAFALLAIPALLAIIILLFARHLYPHPQSLDIPQVHLETKSLRDNKVFWIYLIGAGLVAAGFADFPLIAYHFEKTKVVSMVWVPIAYALAMGVDGVAAPLLGRLYDKYGFIVLIVVTVISCLFAPFVFLGNFSWAIAGVILWSIGMGAHESLMRAVVANMVPANKRASAYGVFNMGFGLFWFLGSVLMGVLYDISIPWLVAFSLLIQLSAIPILALVINKKESGT
ncbi:MAG: MFS transporter [Gammaproteobacteria bacterium]|nr:MFS transporter [Gammaproteobacteria bacterium]